VLLQLASQMLLRYLHSSSSSSCLAARNCMTCIAHCLRSLLWLQLLRSSS
jgi:hypothetical protein